MGKGRYPALIHCFTASQDFADKVLALGLYVSISGIVTFKNAQRRCRRWRRTIPLDRLLIETDSPFLAPVPHRGRPCEPAFVADTARFLAELRGRAARAARRGDQRQFPPPVRQGRGMKVRILGCGTSSGVPRVGNDWGAVRPRRAAEPAPPRLDPGQLRRDAGSWSTPARTCASNCSTPRSATSRR